MLFYATINRAVSLAILTFTQKQQITRLLDSVVVLRPTRHKRVISETFPQASANTTRAGIHQSKEMY